MESITVKTWLYSTLSGDATLTALVGTRIYDTTAPDGSTYPMVLYGPVDNPRDIRGVGASTIMITGLWLVRAINTGQSYAGLEAIADRIHTLLQGASGAGVIGCVREQPFEISEEINGSQYRHLGGIYLIHAQ